MKGLRVSTLSARSGMGNVQLELAVITDMINEWIELNPHADVQQTSLVTLGDGRLAALITYLPAYTLGGTVVPEEPISDERMDAIFERARSQQR